MALDPNHRLSLLEALRPPAGFEIDAAIGTSFTLDLDALLVAPIGFALFEREEANEKGLPPVGVVEAVRRYASKITIYSHAGLASASVGNPVLYPWFERSIVEVKPEAGYFHPKVWFVLYRSRNQPTSILRVLCGSRNLTFDRSWDTILQVDSVPFERNREVEQAAEQNSELIRLVNSLKHLALRPPSANQLAALESITAALRSAELEVPEPYDGLRWHTLGLDKERRDIFPETFKRSLIISPFLGNGSILKDIAERGPINALISRVSSFDALHQGDSPFEWESKSPPELLVPTTQLDDPSPAQAGHDELSGLHAKTAMFQLPGSRTVVFTGSANTSEAGLHRNVELVAELAAPVSQVSIQKTLEGQDSPNGSRNEPGLRSLFVEYSPPDDESEREDEAEIEWNLAAFRGNLASTLATASITESGDDAFALQLTSEGAVPGLSDLVSLEVKPIGMDDSYFQNLRPGRPIDALWDPMTIFALTAFFEVRVRRSNPSRSAKCLLISRVDGEPDDRASKILASLMSDPDRMLRVPTPAPRG